MIIKCKTEFPETRKQEYTKQELLDWVQQLPEHAHITSDSVVEAEWLLILGPESQD